MATSIKSLDSMARPPALGVAALLAVGLGALASGTLLSSCALIHATTAPSVRYDCTAKIIAGDGVLRTIALPQMNLGGLRCADSFSASDNEPNRSVVRDQMRRFLNRALPACNMGAGCPADYGPSPWCVVPDDVHDVVLALDADGNRISQTRNASETGAPLMTCPQATIDAAVSCDDPGAMLAISAVPDPLGAAFGAVGVGTSSAHTFALTNAGSGTLCVRRVAFTTATAADWEARNPTDPEQRCEPTAAEMRTGFALLGAGHRASCSIQVTFTPHAARASEAALSAESGNRSGSHGASLRLTGTGQGGVLFLAAIDAPSAVTDPVAANACVVPYPPAPAESRAYLTLANAGPGIVTIDSMPSDPAWPVEDFLLVDSAGAARRPPGAETAPFRTSRVVIGIGERFRLLARATNPAPVGQLRFGGNQAGGPFNVTLTPQASCP